MQFSAEQIAALLNGRIEGDPHTVVTQLSKIEEGIAGSLSFVSNPKYEHYLYSTLSSIVIVDKTLHLQNPVQATLIRVDDPYLAFTQLLKAYYGFKTEREGREGDHFIHETAQIGEGGYIGAFAYVGKNVKIGNNVKIYPHVYIGDNVVVGDNTTLYPNVTLYYDSVVGQGVTIHAGAVIGGDGFGFAPQKDGTYDKIPQIGNVIIEDDVEIGANTVIDRATMGSTVIRQGVKLDNLIQIAHNVEIGEHSVIAAQTGVSGSTKIGKHVVLGGQVGIVGHVNIADGSQIQAQSGVNRSILVKNAKWSGAPFAPYISEMRSQVIYTKLPDLERRILALEKKLKSQK